MAETTKGNPEVGMKADSLEAAAQVEKAKTDSGIMPLDEKNLSKRPEIENLLGIYSSLTNSTLENSVKNFEGKNFSEFKENLSELVVEKINPISNEIKKLLDDETYLSNILFEGFQKADKIASKKIKLMKEIIGF